MEKVWSDDGNLHKKFLRTLLNNRVTEMVGSAFQINNPNATSGCGCGASFSM